MRKLLIPCIILSTFLSVACSHNATLLEGKEKVDSSKQTIKGKFEALNPPKGRLAIVIDGNSPDPDDIGATPVMLALLQDTGLSSRLVHLSHSCDLDPFRNKARYQIDAENEMRRQNKLDELSRRGIDLFGPFNHLRDFYNCRVDQVGATQDLVDAINASSIENPLWIIEAGEPDLIG